MTTPKKTILLGMPIVSNLYQLIEENLRFHGFEVISTVDDARSFRYPNLKSRLYSKWRKLVHHDREARKNIQWQTLQPRIATKIEAAGGLDYALFISSDVYSVDFLKFIKSQCRLNMANFQFDGLHRFPAIYERMPLFDRFYVFDSHDLVANPNCLPASNFYLDHNLDQIPAQNSVDFYFLGGHETSRLDIVNRFAHYLETRSLSADFSIFWKKSRRHGRKLYPSHTIQLLHRHLHFAENLQHAMQAKILLDFVVNDHNGLSFRCFEALGYRKKLITTNTEILKYDFYHPDNILVWNGQDFDVIDEFIQKPYHEMPSEIYEKYSFGNWIRYILDIQPHQKISITTSSR